MPTGVALLTGGGSADCDGSFGMISTDMSLFFYRLFKFFVIGLLVEPKFHLNEVLSDYSILFLRVLRRSFVRVDHQCLPNLQLLQLDNSNSPLVCVKFGVLNCERPQLYFLVKIRERHTRRPPSRTSPVLTTLILAASQGLSLGTTSINHSAVSSFLHVIFRAPRFL